MKAGQRVKMVRCTATEPEPPKDPRVLEAFVEGGGSARPVQEHVGDTGVVLWIVGSGHVVVRFDDGDERKLYRSELEAD